MAFLLTITAVFCHISEMLRGKTQITSRISYVSPNYPLPLINLKSIARPKIIKASSLHQGNTQMGHLNNKLGRYDDSIKK